MVVNSCDAVATMGIAMASQFDGGMYQVRHSSPFAAILMLHKISGRQYKKDEELIIRPTMIAVAFGADLGASANLLKLH